MEKKIYTLRMEIPQEVSKLVDCFEMGELPIISKEQAIAQGKAEYFTNTPCEKGHISERFVSTDKCRYCMLAEKMLLRNKKRAIRKGRLVYFAEVPCDNGHISQRYVDSDMCVECVRVLNKG